MSQIKCPDPICNDGFIEIPNNIEIGDILSCQNCYSEVEIQSINPEIKVQLIIDSK